jgi:predicted Zn-dependent peptidase
MLFEGHPLGRPILGTTASVRKLRPDDLRAFVKTFFTPDRMAFTVVADIDETVMEKRVLRLVEGIFGGERDTLSSASLRDPIRANAPERVSLSPGACPFSKTVDKHNHEVNAVIGNRAPSLYEQEDRITAAVLCNILGGTASNSLLNKELREKNGWVYGVECTYTQYADTGIAAISFGCDKPNLERCLTALDKILARLRDVPMSERTLKAYKKQLLGQLAISSDNGEAQCLSMGKSLLAWGRIDTSSEMRARIEAVTPEALQKMAARIFDPDRLSRLIYL